MFWKRIFLNRMMEYQVKFCHHSGPRLWRTRMLFSTKSKGHKSNVHISWMYRYRFYDLKVHFWWPNKRLFSYNQRWKTLYEAAETFGYKVLKYHSIFSFLVEFWYDVFKKLVAEIITETISPALGIDGAVSFSRKLENSGLIQTITNLLHNLVSTNIP